MEPLTPSLLSAGFTSVANFGALRPTPIHSRLSGCGDFCTRIVGVVRLTRPRNSLLRLTSHWASAGLKEKKISCSVPVVTVAHPLRSPARRSNPDTLVDLYIFRPLPAILP